MYCSHCGAPNADTSKFCMRCGALLLASATPESAPPLSMLHPSSAPTATPSASGIERVGGRRWLPWLAVGMALLMVLGLGTVVLARTWLHIGTNDAVKLMHENTSMLLSISPNLLQARHWQRLQAIAGAFGVALDSTGAVPTDLLGSGLDIDLERDILPWMGFELAVGVTGVGQDEPGFLAVMAVRNSSGASEFTDKARAQLEAEGRSFAQETYRKVEITYQVSGDSSDQIVYAQTEGFLLVGSSLDSVHQSIDVVQGRSPALSDREAYRRVLRSLSSNRMGYVYFDGGDLQNVVYPNPGPPLSLLTGLEGVGAAFAMETDGIRMDYALGYDEDVLLPGQRQAMTAPSNPNRILAKMPADLVFAANGYNLMHLYQQYLDLLRTGGGDPEFIVGSIEQGFGLDLEQDILSWTDGEYALAVIEDVQGLMGDASTPLSILVLVDTTDLSAAETAMTRIASAIEYESSVSFADETIGDREFRIIRDDYGDVMLGYGFIENTLVIGSSRRALTAGADASVTPLAEDGAFKMATSPLPRRNGGYLYLDVENCLGALYQGMMDDEQLDFDRYVRTYLADLQIIALASEQPVGVSGMQRGTVFLGFKSR